MYDPNPNRPLSVVIIIQSGVNFILFWSFPYLKYINFCVNNYNILSNIQTNITQILKFTLIVNANMAAMTSHKNAKRQGELQQCVASVSEREENASEDECETGGNTVTTDEDSGSEDDNHGVTEEERNEVEDVELEE